MHNNSAKEAARIVSDKICLFFEDINNGEMVLPAEDDITPALLNSIKDALKGKVSGLNWKASVSTHRGKDANEEGKSGADILI